MYTGNYTEEISSFLILRLHVSITTGVCTGIGLHAWEVELLCAQYIHSGLMCLVLSLIPGHPYMELQIRFLLL